MIKWLLISLLFCFNTYSLDYEMGPDGRPLFMQGWNENQIRQFYIQQQTQRMNAEQAERDKVVQEQRMQAVGGAFGYLQEQANQKLQKAKELREKAESNKRKGFGKLQLSLEDYRRRKLMSVGMELGTKDHRYGCYSQDSSSMGFVASASVGGVPQKVEIEVSNLGNRMEESLTLRIRKGLSDLTFNLNHTQFKRFGNRIMGEIMFKGPVVAVSQQGKPLGKLRSGGWIRYFGCAQEEGPSGGGMEAGGYGGGGY